MALLVVGVLIFTLAHLFPAIMKTRRDSLAEQLGTSRYQGLFALVIVASIVIIVAGWKSAVPSAVYAPVVAPGLLTSGLMLVASILFVATVLPTNLKRWVRHPQMTATLIWSVTHLLANGDSRSVVLFGGLGLWSIAEIVFCNRRDGAWQKPAPVPRSKDAIYVVAGVILFAAFTYFHRGLFGVSVAPGVGAV